MTHCLRSVSTPDLEALLQLIESRELACPITRARLSSHGLSHLADALLPLLEGLDSSAVHVALRVAAAERIAHGRPHTELVWTGPDVRGQAARDTSIVVRQLFEEASSSVLVGGFAFDHGEQIFAPLHAAMRDRGVTATFFLDIEGHAKDPALADAHATQSIDTFFRKNWPFGNPKPDVYYDPRTAVAGPPWVSLHAKCVVIDDRKAFVTSANFTDRGQTRNIEVGVLVHSTGFARDLAAHWRALVREKAVTRYAG